MATPTHHLSSIAPEEQPLLFATILLQASRNLWRAPDRKAVVASATALLESLAPGTRVECCRPDADTLAAAHHSADCSLHIRLSEHEVLKVDTPDGHGPASLLQAAAELVEERINALDQQPELTHGMAQRTQALQDANRVLETEVLERKRSERLQAALFRIAELASSTDSIKDFYAALHLVVGDLLYARNFFIALLSEDGSQLTFPYMQDEHHDLDRPRAPANGLTEYVMRKGATLLAHTQEIRQLIAHGSITPHGPEATSWLGVPLKCDGNTVGVLAVQSYSTDYGYTRHDQELLTFVSYHIANAVVRKRAAQSLQQANEQLEDRVKQRTQALALANRDLHIQIHEREHIEERLKYQNLHDSLTGLPNRALFLQRLELALARYHADPMRGFAVLFMDLDRFKVINDSEGHLTGDDLLIQVGKRINACVKSDDVVARMGGDEFSVLLEDMTDATHACRIAERIINHLNVPVRLADKELFTSTSIGITMAAPHYRSPDELLRDADSAMYRAKAQGRRCYAVFDDEMRQQAVALLELENDLRRALPRHEFVPYYQPIVDLANGNVIGYEALMRWHHPQRGVLTPGQFLSVAEDSGISETIDWQIFTQVCRDANALTEKQAAFVSINLSARHFTTPGFELRLLQLLAKYQVPTTRLYVEVTEGALLENTRLVKQALSVFRQAGINIALDDFGTGYASLSYLHKYPLHTLKIDKSFVANLTGTDSDNNDAVIRAILAMAQMLSINVIAEGVETTEQRDLLYRLGCRRGQGFFYSDAQPITAWTKQNRPVFHDMS